MSHLKKIFRGPTKDKAMGELDGIKVHQFTDNPTKAWSMLKVKQKVKKVTCLPLDTPIYPDKVRFVCISDTHHQTHKMNPIPNGDVLLHAGDFTFHGEIDQTIAFNEFLGSLPHKYKVVIAGNHDITFDEESLATRPNLKHVFRIDVDKLKATLCSKTGKENPHMWDLLTNCIYLQDSAIDIYGLKIYGSPWQPEFCGWGFNVTRGKDILEKWNLIPKDVDVLLTHGPPIGHGDICFDGLRTGCVELLSVIQNRVQPKYHIFGHIHEGYGVTTDGTTTFINASTCTLRYKPTNPPILFDLPLPEGYTKENDGAGVSADYKG
ncbi:metallophosphoesterase MPPED2 [Lingula anatina]|uniref:Metallophosphoesterase MPPED2 n=1 Tax=Lingula anatina TaxID=7574 RepID=A0A1S3H988_LINAN|nr:metallophosphoesterase MPPED2 [Lingula anatina]|eukprot:XP_013381694.1 metallophosphoesterase MPPED2 [Lingula anatina]